MEQIRGSFARNRSQAFQEYLAWVTNSDQDFWRQKGKHAFFWSGDSLSAFDKLKGDFEPKANEVRASSWASVTNGYLFSETRGFRFLFSTVTEDHRIADYELELLIKAASWRFAREAEGNIRVYTLDEKGNCPEKSIFLTIELPTLLLNPNVSTINGKSRDELLKLSEVIHQDINDVFGTLKSLNEELNNRRELNLVQNRALRELYERQQRRSAELEQRKEPPRVPQISVGDLSAEMRRKEAERREQKERANPDHSHSY